MTEELPKTAREILEELIDALEDENVECRVEAKPLGVQGMYVNPDGNALVKRCEDALVAALKFLGRE
jgi:hypothetical protein